MKDLLDQIAEGPYRIMIISPNADSRYWHVRAGFKDEPRERVGACGKDLFSTLNEAMGYVKEIVR